MRRSIGALVLVVAVVVPAADLGVDAVDRRNIADGPCSESTTTPLTNAVVPRPGGGVVVGGSFSFVGAQTGTAARVDATTGDADRAFAAFLGRIEVVLPDDSGGWYVAGSLNNVDGVSITGVAHIGSDGRRVASFTATANGAVRTLARSGSTLYLGGSFSTVNGTARKGLAAVDTTTGALASFDPVVTTGSSSGTVRALVVEGTTVYVGGTFTNAGGESRSNLAAIDTGTGLATSWNPGASDAVNALAAADGMLYVGGLFSQVNGSTNRSRAAAFDLATGAVTSWNPNIGGASVAAIDVDDSTVYVGGSFSLVNGGGQARSNAAAFDVSTGAATSWNPSPNADVLTVDVADPGVYLGGTFTTLAAGTVERRRAAAVDGSVGTALEWNPRAGTTVTDIAVAGGVAVLGGEFTCMNLVARNGLAGIDRTGRLTGWDPMPSAGTTVKTLELEGDDLYVGGSFTSLGGETRNGLGRVSMASGAVDPWDPGVMTSGVVNDVAVEDDSVYLVGVFTSVAGTARGHAAAVSASTGSLLAWDPRLDVAFTVAANWQPGRALEIVDGSVYVGGDFTQVSGGTSRLGLAVFDSAGVVQATDISTNNAVTSLDSSGSTLFVGGAFSSVSGTTRERAAAVDLETDAVLAWNPSPNSTVSGLTVDGATVYLAGSFTSLGNAGVGGIAARQGLGAVDAMAGGVLPWNPSATTGTGVSVAVDGQRVYAAGNLVMARHHVVHLGNRSTVALFAASEPTTIGSSTASAAAVTEVNHGETVADVATVSSFDGMTDPTGSVTFYVCSGDSPPTACDDTIGSPVGVPVPLDPGVVGDGVSSASLPGWQPGVGHHLVHVEYHGSGVHERSDGAGTDSVVHVLAALCSVGTYSANGHEPCVDAPIGSYVAVTGATSPTECPVGTWTLVTGSSECIPDPTAPIVTAAVTGGTRGSGGWYVSGPVAVSFAVDDPHSDEVVVGCQGGTVSASTVSSVFACTATSPGGTTSRSVTVRLDAEAPTIVFPGRKATYDVLATVAIGCNAADATSGVASTSCAGLSQPAWRLPVGRTTVRASATDRAGHTTIATTSFVVKATSKDLCALTSRFVVASKAYSAAGKKIQRGLRAQVKASCAAIPKVVTYGRAIDKMVKARTLATVEAKALKRLVTSL